MLKAGGTPGSSGKSLRPSNLCDLAHNVNDLRLEPLNGLGGESGLVDLCGEGFPFGLELSPPQAPESVAGDGCGIGGGTAHQE